MKKIFALLTTVVMLASMFAGIAFAAVPTFLMSPANAATGVSINVRPTVVFSEGIRNADGTPITDVASLITLRETDAAGAVVPFTATLSADRTLITVMPNAPLKNSQRYFIDVAPVLGASLNTLHTLDIPYRTWTTEAVAAPVATPAAGAIAWGTTVALTTATVGAEIRFTTDGSAPTITSTLYTAPITINAATTIRAIAVRGTALSAELSAAYTQAAVANPVIGSVVNNTVAITTATPGATIRFTTDGTNPTAITGTVYTAPIALTAATTNIRAIAVLTGMLDSTVVLATRNLQVAAPVITFDPATRLAIITTATAGATITYQTSTDNGATYGSLTTYNTPFIVAAGVTHLRAIATLGIETATTTQALAAQATAAAPVASPAAGAVQAGTQVTLTAEPGALIFYTANATNATNPVPGAADTLLYTAPITITAATEIRAIAVRAGMQNSAVATFAYTIAAAPLPQVFLSANIIHGAVGLNNNVVIGGALAELGQGALSAQRFFVVQRRAPNATVWATAPGAATFSLPAGSVGSFNFQYRFTQAGDYRLAVLNAAGGAVIRQDGADVAVNLGTVLGQPLSVTTPTTTARWSIDPVPANQTITLPITAIREAAGVLPVRVVDGTGTLGNNMVDGTIAVTYTGGAVTHTATFSADGVTTLVITRGAATATGTLLITVTDDTGNWSGQVSVNVTALAQFNATTRLVDGALVAGDRVQFETTVAVANGGDIAANQYTMTTITNPAGGALARLRMDGTTAGQSVRSAVRNIAANPPTGILLTTPGAYTVTTVLYDNAHNELGRVVETFNVGGGLVVNLTSARVGETVRLSATVTDRNGNPQNAARVRFVAVDNRPIFVVRDRFTGLFPTHPAIANATHEVIIDGWNLIPVPGQAVSNGVFTAEVVLVNTGEVHVEVYEAVQPGGPGTAIVAAGTPFVNRTRGVTILPRLYTVTVEQSTFVTAHSETLTFTVRDAAGNLVNEPLAAPTLLELNNENLTPSFAPTMVSPGVWSGLFTAEEPGRVRIRMAGLGDNAVNGVEFVVTVVNPRVEISTSTSLVTSDFYETVTVRLFDPRNDQPIALPLQVREGRVRTPDRAWRPTANLTLETRASATAPWANLATTGVFTGLGTATNAGVVTAAAEAQTADNTTQVRNFAPAAVHEFRVLTWSRQRQIAGVEQAATLRFMASQVEGSISEHFVQTLAPATIELSAPEIRAGVANRVTLTLKNAHGVAFGSIPQQGAGAAMIPAVFREIQARGRWVRDFNMPESGVADLVIDVGAAADGLVEGNIRFEVLSDRTGDPVALRTDVRVVAPLDTAAPVIDVTAPATVTTATAQITVTVTDDNMIERDGVAFNGVRFYMNAAPTFTFVRNVDLVVGDNNFIVSARDRAGNVTNRTITITRTAPPADAARPTIEVTAPSITTDASAMITIVARDNVAVTGVIFEGAPVSVFPAATVTVLRTVTLREGLNSFTLAVTDAAGNVAERIIVIERRAPAAAAHVITIGRANPAIGLDVPANVRNGRLMVPFRWFAERILEATVDFKVVGAAEIVTLHRGNMHVELTLNSTIAKVNGVPVALDVAPFATGGRTLVPARFLAETFGYIVNWNPVNDEVTFTVRP